MSGRLELLLVEIADLQRRPAKEELLTVTANDESIINLARQIARITESPLTKLFLLTTPHD